MDGLSNGRCWRDGLAHQRPVRELRCLRPGLSQQCDHPGPDDLRDRRLALHRVRGSFRYSAMRGGMSGGMHRSGSGSPRNPGRTDGKVPATDRGDGMKLRPLLVLFLGLLLAAPLTHARQGSEPVLPRQAAIATANAYATDAGLEVLANGGNAFDAAIAVSATLGLVEPESSGIGGGGFMQIGRASCRGRVEFA